MYYGLMGKPCNLAPGCPFKNKQHRGQLCGKRPLWPQQLDLALNGRPSCHIKCPRCCLSSNGALAPNFTIYLRDPSKKTVDTPSSRKEASHQHSIRASSRNQNHFVDPAYRPSNSLQSRRRVCRQMVRWATDQPAGGTSWSARKG